MGTRVGAVEGGSRGAEEAPASKVAASKHSAASCCWPAQEAVVDFVTVHDS